METNLKQLFKAYDIRGLAPEQINAEFARRLARAVCTRFDPKRVLVGRDMRTTSFALESALIQELTLLGVGVVRAGLCSTPMFYAVVGLAQNEKSNIEAENPDSDIRHSTFESRPFDLGIMVTASHNPGKYNGFKIVRGDCLPVGEGSGMEELRDAFEQDAKPTAQGSGQVVDDPEALDHYVDLVINEAHLPAKLPQTKIAIDAGNGMAGSVLPRLLSKLPWIESVPMYFDPDGSFPNHEANPLKRETLNDLVATVRDEKCALGVAFDGDADRVGFVDETGEPIPGDIMTAFLAQEILKEKPGGKVLYDVRSSWAVPEAVKEAGGVSEMCRVGHALVKREMRKTGAIFAGELSMHIYFSQLWNCECGDLAMLLVLRRLIGSGKTLSELVRPLRRYFQSGEMNFEVADKAGVIARLKEKYASAASLVSELDGIRLEFRHPAAPLEDWWFNVRASNTEPLLRLNTEARTLENLERHINELRGEILKPA